MKYTYKKRVIKIIRHHIIRNFIYLFFFILKKILIYKSFCTKIHASGKNQTVQKDIQYKVSLFFFTSLTSVLLSKDKHSYQLLCIFPEIIHVLTSILYICISIFIQIVAYYTCCYEFCFFNILKLLF